MTSLLGFVVHAYQEAADVEHAQSPYFYRFFDGSSNCHTRAATISLRVSSAYRWQFSTPKEVHEHLTQLESTAEGSFSLSETPDDATPIRRFVFWKLVKGSFFSIVLTDCANLLLCSHFLDRIVGLCSSEFYAVRGGGEVMTSTIGLEILRRPEPLLAILDRLCPHGVVQLMNSAMYRLNRRDAESKLLT